MTHADDDTVIPAGTAVERYQPIWKRSPFTLASTPDAQASAEWSLGGLAENGQDPLVFLVNKQSQERMTVTGQPNEKGFSVESIDYQSDLLQSSVKIKTSGDTLTVRFDPSVVVAQATQPTPANGATANVATPQPPGTPLPGAVPSNDPHRRIMPRIIIPNPLPGNPPPTPAHP